MANIIEAIQERCNELRDVYLPEYDKIPTGVFAATMIRQAIKRAESAIASDDVQSQLPGPKRVGIVERIPEDQKTVTAREDQPRLGTCDYKHRSIAFDGVPHEQVPKCLNWKPVAPEAQPRPTPPQIFCPSCGWDISTELAGEAQGAAPQDREYDPLIEHLESKESCGCGEGQGCNQSNCTGYPTRVEAEAQPPQDALLEEVVLAWEKFPGTRKEFYKWIIERARSTPSPDPPEEVPRNYVDSRHLDNEGRGTLAGSEQRQPGTLPSGEVLSTSPLSNERPSELTPDSPPQIVSAPELAQKFHEAYERLAPQFGYETRKESAKPWEEVPENNRGLMTAVCEEILKYASSSNAALQQQLAQARKERDEADMSWSVRYDQEVGHLQRLSQGYVLRMEQAERKSERWADCAAKTGEVTANNTVNTDVESTEKG